MSIPETAGTGCTCPMAKLAKPLAGIQSPMAELLSTFAAPSRQECITIRGRMAQIAVDMSQLDNEIERVETILTSLRHNSATLHKIHGRHHNLLNLTRRLPIEILGEIFIQLQDMLPGGRSIAPTQVCRQWRGVAIATSKLWSNIDTRRLLRADAEEMIPIWLQRSSGQPLKIVLGRKGVRGNKAEGNPILDAMIHNQSHRWKYIKFLITNATLSFLKNIPEDLPMLHSLYLDADHRLNPVTIVTLNNFRHAAGLRVLTLGNRVSLAIPELPWARLTTCTLMSSGSYTCEDGYFVLSQAVNLQFYKMGLSGTSNFSQAGIRHASLLSLHIRVDRGANSRDLFNLLTLPALTELKLRGSWALNVPECLASLITRSGCSLTQLSLDTRDLLLSHNQLRNIFNATPMLSKLELLWGAAVGVDDALMDLLTHFRNHNAGLCCLLPQLTSIKWSIHNGFSYETFAHLLASRLYDKYNCTLGRVPRDGLAQIRTVVLKPWGPTGASGRRLPEETFQDMIALRNSGLDFSVEGSSSSSLESYFVPGEQEDDSESEDDDDEED